MLTEKRAVSSGHLPQQQQSMLLHNGMQTAYAIWYITWTLSEGAC